MTLILFGAVLALYVLGMWSSKRAIEELRIHETEYVSQGMEPLTKGEETFFVWAWPLATLLDIFEVVTKGNNHE